jgi:hypothetical protein
MWSWDRLLTRLWFCEDRVTWRHHHSTVHVMTETNQRWVSTRTLFRLWLWFSLETERRIISKASVANSDETQRRFARWSIPTCRQGWCSLSKRFFWMNHVVSNHIWSGYDIVSGLANSQYRLWSQLGRSWKSYWRLKKTGYGAWPSGRNLNMLAENITTKDPIKLLRPHPPPHPPYHANIKRPLLF